MNFNIDPQVALETYEHAKKRLKELEEKKFLLLKNGIVIPSLDAIIERQKEEMNSCAYYAFGYYTQK